MLVVTPHVLRGRTSLRRYASDGQCAPAVEGNDQAVIHRAERAVALRLGFVVRVLIRGRERRQGPCGASLPFLAGLSPVPRYAAVAGSLQGLWRVSFPVRSLAGRGRKGPETLAPGRPHRTPRLGPSGGALGHPGRRRRASGQPTGARGEGAGAGRRG